MRDIAAKARTASAEGGKMINNISTIFWGGGGGGGGGTPTYRCNYLRLYSNLILKASCKVCDTSTTITSDIRNFSNLIIHMPTGKSEYSNQAECSP